MAGILNNKLRVLDVIVTDEGQRQMSSGKFTIEFASFTDGHTYYEADAASGSSDASDRIFFEAVRREADQITLETDDAGQLIGLKAGSIEMASGYLFKEEVTGSNKGMMQIASGSEEFASIANSILISSLNHFNQLNTLGTKHPFVDSSDFTISPKSGSFYVNNTNPFSPEESFGMNINSIEPLFYDQRLSHISNFKYLSPIIRTLTGRTRPLGDYPDLRQASDLTFEDIKKQLEGTLKLSNGKKFSISREPRQFQAFKFSPTMLHGNNLVMQMFEIHNNRMTKLDVIDFGEIYVSNNSSESKRVFFAGKVFLDEFEIPTYVNLFTIILG